MRQVVILESPKSGGTTRMDGFFWFAVTDPLARVPRPQFVSAGVTFIGAKAITAAEQLTWTVEL